MDLLWRSLIAIFIGTFVLMLIGRLVRKARASRTANGYAGYTLDHALPGEPMPHPRIVLRAIHRKGNHLISGAELLACRLRDCGVTEIDKLESCAPAIQKLFWVSTLSLRYAVQKSEAVESIMDVLIELKYIRASGRCTPETKEACLRWGNALYDWAQVNQYVVRPLAKRTRFKMSRR